MARSRNKYYKFVKLLRRSIPRARRQHDTHTNRFKRVWFLEGSRGEERRNEGRYTAAIRVILFIYSCIDSGQLIIICARESPPHAGFYVVAWARENCCLFFPHQIRNNIFPYKILLYKIRVFFFFCFI